MAVMHIRHDGGRERYIGVRGVTGTDSGGNGNRSCAMSPKRFAAATDNGAEV